jgi:hypothetical protein
MVVKHNAPAVTLSAARKELKRLQTVVSFLKELVKDKDAEIIRLENELRRSKTNVTS